nr:DUF4173 domain-containing protein [Bacteroidota bacterium]
MKKNDWILLFSLAVYSVLFYAQSFGINFLLFSVFVCIMLFVRNKELIKNKTWNIVALCTIASGFAVFVYGNYLSFVANVISLSILSALRFNQQTSILLGLLYAVYSYVGAIAYMFKDYAERKKVEVEKSHPMAIKILLVVIPVLIVTVFFLLYQSSNPVFYNFTQKINFDFISLAFIRFVIIGFILLYGFYYHRTINIFQTADEQAANNLRKENAVYKSFFGNGFTIEYENISGQILLGLLNVLLLTVNLLDIIYLWGTGGLPQGMSYAAFLHQGTGTLITSIVLAVSIILFYFRGALNYFEKNKSLRILAFVWVLQNIFMVISTAYRNHIYIEEYFLTYKRIGVYVYLFLCVIGLVTTFIKIKNIKSNWYLFRVNSWWCYALLIACSFVSWDLLITKFNVSTATEKNKPIDKNYLIGLGYINLPDLILMNDSLQNKASEEENDMISFSSEYERPNRFSSYAYLPGDNFKSEINYKLYTFLDDVENHDWQSFCGMKHEQYNALFMLGGQKKITTIDISNRSIESLMPLKNIKHIGKLDVSKNRIKNIDELKYFTEVEDLNIAQNNFDTIASVPLLPKLKTLNISSNKIYPLHKLSSWNTIEKLTAIEINSRELKGLPTFPKLRELDLSSNNLANIPPLDKYPLLEKVALRNCKSIEEYEFPLMPSIKSIDLSNNGFNLQKNFVLDNLLLLPNVQEVDLSNNNMIYIPKASSNVAELNKQTFFDGITYLNINNNRIDDLHGIEKFISLNNLIISSNKLWTLNGIQNSTQLKYLNINQNEFLTDIKAIQNLTSLQSLDMTGCFRVQNWEYLNGLSQLQSLSVSRCGLKKMNFLISLNQLTSLDCSNNNLTDLSFLFQLQNLTELNLSENKIENLAPLYSLKKLKRLIINKVTSPEEITKLQKMLPNTEIICEIFGNENTDTQIVDAVMPATTNNNGE